MKHVIKCVEFFSELIYFSGIEWHKIRGAQMLIAMKVISVAFDADFGVLQHIPTPVQFAGYILCAGTCVFGPWVPFRDYMAIYNNKPFWVCFPPYLL